MSKVRFIEWSPRGSTLDTIYEAGKIIDEYRAQGYSLSLRQLYYQLVASDILPNKQREYNRLGRILTKARMAGYISWDTIEDRNREAVVNTHWESPAKILASASRSFRLNRWLGQPERVIVMAEKDAVSGVLGPVCQELDVMYTANKGYASASHLYDMGQIIKAWAEHDIATHIIYFGDFDPSGLDMDRDILERLDMFSWYKSGLELHRVALTMPQIDEYGPPPNPAKLTDSRADSYIMEHGYSSWELDALKVSTLADIAREMITSYIDNPELYEERVALEAQYAQELKALAKKYKEDNDEH